MSDRQEGLMTAPPRLLVDAAEGRLDDDEIGALEIWLRAGGLTPAPPWAKRRAERLARRRRLVTIPAGADRFVASLAFDSRVEPQFVGLRAAQTQVRRLLFQAENIEVDLEVTKSSGEKVRLAGQITAGGEDPSEGFLRLSRGDDEWIVPLDETGEFSVSDLAPGAYRLEVVLEGRVVEVPVLPI